VEKKTTETVLRFGPEGGGRTLTGGGIQGMRQGLAERSSMSYIGKRSPKVRREELRETKN